MAVISRQQPVPCVLLYLSIPLRPFHGLPIVPANARALRETRFNLARLPPFGLTCFSRNQQAAVTRRSDGLVMLVFEAQPVSAGY